MTTGPGTAGNSNLQPGGGWELIKLKETQWTEGFVYSGPYWAEAEHMSRRDLRVVDNSTVSEDQVVEGHCKFSPCRAAIIFSVDSGTYDIAVRYYDPGFKTSGSWMKLYVNSVLVGERRLNQNRGWYSWHVDNRTINKGNKVEIVTSMDKSSLSNRFALDFFDFVPR